MRRRRWIGAMVGVGVAATTLAAWPSGGAAIEDDESLEELARDAVSSDDRIREAGLARLRILGPEGLTALATEHAPSIERLRRGERDPSLEPVRRAIDRVSGQRDGHASGLHWHTDLDAARRQAERTGRPILSLRLLGRLDEELSCANSRYFRIVLYADPRVSAFLARSFVLHWSSERPAPRITIDMGDGRRVVRTITGNSVHYVLDAQGRPLDAIVGLYAPAAFVDALETARAIAETCGALGGDGRDRCLARLHATQAVVQRQAWTRLEGRDPSIGGFDAAVASLPGAASDPAPSARAAMPLTVSKAAVETPMLGLLGREAAATPAEPIDWHRVGVLRHGAAPLSARTRALLRLKTGSDDVDGVAQRLAELAVADGARNEVLFRRRVHGWFATELASIASFEALNARVYRELLLTPADDPWLGLRADDLYDGVELGAE